MLPISGAGTADQSSGGWSSTECLKNIMDYKLQLHQFTFVPKRGFFRPQCSRRDVGSAPVPSCTRRDFVLGIGTKVGSDVGSDVAVGSGSFCVGSGSFRGLRSFDFDPASESQVTSIMRRTIESANLTRPVWHGVVRRPQVAHTVGGHPLKRQ
jgi:hypothetical protein